MDTVKNSTELSGDDNRYEVLEQILDFENMDKLTKGEEVRYANLYVYHMEQFYDNLLGESKNLGLMVDLEKSKLLDLNKFKGNLKYKSSIAIVDFDIDVCMGKISNYNKRIDNILTQILMED